MQQPRSIALLGAAGSGKTSLALALAQEQHRPIYHVLQDNPERRSDILTFDEVVATVTTQPVALIFDDVIQLSSGDQAVLRFCLNKATTHHGLQLYVLSHHIFHTGLFALVHAFDAIYVMSFDRKIVPMFVRLLAHLNFDERSALVSQLEQNAGTFGYMALDIQGGAAQMMTCKDRAFCYQEEPAGMTFLNVFCDPQRAKLLYNIFRPTLRLFSKQDVLFLKNSAPLSVYDYIHTLLSTQKPTPILQQLHFFLRQYVVLPSFLYHNTFLKHRFALRPPFDTLDLMTATSPALVLSYFEYSIDPKASRALFHLIQTSAVLSAATIFRLRQGSLMYYVHVADYIELLLKPEAGVSPLFLAIHRQVMRRCIIPKFCIANKLLRSAA